MFSFENSMASPRFAGRWDRQGRKKEKSVERKEEESEQGHFCSSHSGTAQSERASNSQFLFLKMLRMGRIWR